MNSAFLCTLVDKVDSSKALGSQDTPEGASCWAHGGTYFNDSSAGGIGSVCL